MKSSISIAVMLLFAFSALSLGLAYADEIEATINETESNETLGNETLTNTSLENTTLTNETLANASLINETLANATLNNETLNNLTEPEDGASPFADVKGRQPKPRN
ncbi:MAG: hypothetical protein LUO89_13255 [Methanothrix sp.]|jgi:uncharacterized protein YjbI with pentapeptide repeats|nr:hypothetical protein [Methanothrix sp.]